jgi:hypothetical protein
MKSVSTLCLATIFAGSLVAAASAQTTVQPRDPNMPAPQNTIPEKMEEPSTTGTVGPNDTLSEKLEATDGVIRPPSNIAPDMTVPAPVPNPGTTPVIPPPGSPGGDPSIQPR